MRPSLRRTSSLVNRRILFCLLLALAFYVARRPAYAQDPGLRTRAWNDAMLLMRQSHYEKAETALDTAIKNGDHGWKAHLLRGYCRYRLGEEGALSDFNMVEQHRPRMAYVWAAEAMAVALIHRFDPDERQHAVTLMSIAVQEAPRVPIYYALRGRLEMGVNRFNDAMEDFNRAVKMSPDDVSILKMRYQALLEWGGHKKQAARDADAIKRLDPRGTAPDPDLPPPPIPAS